MVVFLGSVFVGGVFDGGVFDGGVLGSVYDGCLFLMVVIKVRCF